jgi:hypothetical protein
MSGNHNLIRRNLGRIYLRDWNADNLPSSDTKSMTCKRKG